MRALVVGITGLPGTGKTSFANAFKTFGIGVIEADRLGHEVLNDPEVRSTLVGIFGATILRDGEIFRPELAKLVFGSNRIETLNQVCHPAIRRKILHVLNLAPSSSNYMILDAALLFEAGFDDLCQLTVCLEASFETRLKRVSSRGWSSSELKNRDEHQDASLKQSRSNLCLNGEVSEKHLRPWVKKLDIVLRYASAMGRPEKAHQLLQSWKYPLLLA